MVGQVSLYLMFLKLTYNIMGEKIGKRKSYYTKGSLMVTYLYKLEQ